MKLEHAFTFVLCLFSAACGSAERGFNEPISPSAKNAPLPPSEPPGSGFDNEHRWQLSDPTAVKALQNTSFGEQEINEFWVRKGWHLTQKEDRYMMTTEQLLAQGRIKKTAHWSMTPFTPVFTAQETVTIEGVRIPKGTEFWMELNENEDAIKLGNPIFGRTDGYKEEHQGHVDQASSEMH